MTEMTSSPEEYPRLGKLMKMELVVEIICKNETIDSEHLWCFLI